MGMQPVVVRVAFLAAIALVAVNPPNHASAAPGSVAPISVEDVIRLARAGLSEEIIVQQIRRKGPPRQITADQIIALKNAALSDRVIRAMLQTPPAGNASPVAPPSRPSRAQPAPAPTKKSPPSSRTTAVAARESPPPPGTGGWVSHTDPMGFSLNHPAGWKVDTDAKWGRLRVQGDRGECVIVWPMFVEKRQIDDLQAAVLVRQLASKLEPRMPWSAPKASGRFVVTGARTAQRKNAIMMTWANSQNGSAILLYSVSTPADSYSAATATLAGVLQSFRILRFSGAREGAPGNRAPLGAVQYDRWTDPMENAFSVSVPRGWKVVGGMYRFSPTDSRLDITALAPDGGILIKLGQKDFGAFMEPMANFRSGSLPQPDGSQIQILSYLSGQQFARYYAERVRQECGSVRVVSGNNRPDLVATMSQAAQSDGVPAGQVTVGDITFTCSAQSQELRGYYLAATVLIPTDASRSGMGGAMWFVYRLCGYLSIPEWQQSAGSISREVVRSVQVNPEWRARIRQTSSAIVAQDNARSQQLRSRAFAAIAENQRQTSDLISKSYWAQQARYDEISRKRENGILGAVEAINPATGETYKVQYNANYYWMNDAGYMAGTLTNDPPAVGWQQMIQLP